MNNYFEESDLVGAVYADVTGYVEFRNDLNDGITMDNVQVADYDLYLYAPGGDYPQVAFISDEGDKRWPEEFVDKFPIINGTVYSDNMFCGINLDYGPIFKILANGEGFMAEVPGADTCEVYWHQNENFLVDAIALKFI